MFRKINLTHYINKALRHNNIPIRNVKYFSDYRNGTNDNISKYSSFNTNHINISQLSNYKTNLELINENFGLRDFIKKTYLWTGAGIGGSIGLSVIGSQIIKMYPDCLINVCGLGTVMALGGAVGICFTKYSVHKDIISNSVSNSNSISNLNLNSVSNSNSNSNMYIYNNTNNTFDINDTYDTNDTDCTNNTKNIEILYSVNSTGRMISYGCLITGVGIGMTPLYLTFPNAIFPAFIASSCVFYGSTWYTMKKGVGELKPYGGVLYGGLGGLVGVSLLGVGSNLIYGTNWFGDITHLISLYGGIPLFTGLVAYDTHEAIEMYESGNPDHLGCSTQLYLDFVNLFVKFVEIIGKIQSKD